MAAAPMRGEGGVVSLFVDRKGSGPDLVLLHGWGMNAAVWAGLSSLLTGNRRVSRIELPGHGLSHFEPSHADQAAWPDACLEAAPERAVWIGWSLGGLIALEAALRRPERFVALVLLAATPRFVRTPNWPTAMDAETLSRFREGLLADPAATLDRFLSLQVRGGYGARNGLRTLRRDIRSRPAPAPSALAVGLDLLRDGDLRGRLGGLSCQSLWLFGQRDTLVPCAVAAGIAELLPEAGLHVIPGAAHAPFLSHPDETAAEITQFLSEVAC